MEDINMECKKMSEHMISLIMCMTMLKIPLDTCNKLSFFAGNKHTL